MLLVLVVVVVLAGQSYEACQAKQSPRHLAATALHWYPGLAEQTPLTVHMSSGLELTGFER